MDVAEADERIDKLQISRIKNPICRIIKSEHNHERNLAITGLLTYNLFVILCPEIGRGKEESKFEYRY